MKNFTINNNTSFSSIIVKLGSEERTLTKGQTTTFSIDEDTVNLHISVLEKNRVLVNYLFALVDGFLSEESVISSLIADVQLKICANSENNILTLIDLEYRDDKKGYIYESVYAESDNSKIIETNYLLTDATKQKKKAFFLLAFIVSWLPVIILLFAHCIIKGNILTLLVALLVFFVSTLPAWKKAKNLKKYYSVEFINDKLQMTALQKAQNGGKDLIAQPNDIIGKAVYKTLDKVFKKK